MILRKQKLKAIQFIINILLLFFSTGVFAGTSSGVLPDQLEKYPKAHKVLLLNSYHKGFLWTDEITRGIEDNFKDKNIDFHIEYMDTKRQYNPPYLAALTNLLALKHKTHQYDLVITSDNNAFNYMNGEGKSIFGDVPHIFCGVNYLSPADLQGLTNITGINEEIDIVSNLKLIKSLHPDCKKVLITTENTITGHHILKEIYKIQKTGQADLEIEVVYDISIRDLGKKLQSLKQGTVVLQTIFSRDREGRFFEYDESARFICSVSPVPVYGSWDFTMGSGIIGGFLVDGYQQGNAAARKALRVLSGKDINAIPVLWETPVNPRFDYRKLAEYNISEKLLPEGSEIMYKPKTFYQEYKVLIINVVTVFSLLLIAIFGLLWGFFNARKSKNEALESEEKFRILAETTSVGILVYQNDKWVYINPAAQKICGYTFEELNNFELWKIVAPEFKEKIKQTVRRRQQNLKTNNEYELKILTKEAGEKWVLLNGSSIKYKSEYAGLVSIVDITVRKNAVKQLQQMQNYLSNIIDSMPSILISVDKAGLITQWNNKAQKSTGISAKEARGKPLREVFPQFADESDLIFKSIQSREIRQDLKRSRMTENGQVFEDFTVYPLVTDDTEGAAIIISDITQKVQMEEMMIQSEKMLSVGGLAAGIAHEINNPLAGMMQNAAVLKNRMKKNSPKNLQIAQELGVDFEIIKKFMEKRDMVKQLDLIYTSGERASKLVNNMLSFARKSEQKFKPSSVPEIMDNALDLVKNDYNIKKHYDFKKIKVIKEYQPGLSPVNCEETKIEQVFINILKNGAEAMHTENMQKNHPKFIIRIFSKNSFIHIEIENNGPPIPYEKRKRIFEPFFTTKNTGRGTGLGLSLSYFIITKNHKGKMWVETKQNRNTNFVIELPGEQKI